MRGILLLALSIILSLGSSSCITDLGDETFLIRVDSVMSAPTARLGDVMVFRLAGFVGPDGRYSFWRIEEMRTDRGAEITVWGRKRGTDTYTAEAKYLEGLQFETKATRPGEFILAIRQPGGSRLLDTVLVQ